MGGETSFGQTGGLYAAKHDQLKLLGLKAVSAGRGHPFCHVPPKEPWDVEERLLVGAGARHSAPHMYTQRFQS